MEGKIAILLQADGYFSTVFELTLFTLKEGIWEVHYKSVCIFQMDNTNNILFTTSSYTFTFPSFS